ncbi:hypothetical protein GCM10017691_35140 [Pseudonocardia petroleophila]|uniref:hypothetical protein n=1 Tax=Pseudonocardia petroleophila TaxID=37331 RepID=UPI0031E03D28
MPAVVLPPTPIGPVATPPVTVGGATVTTPDLGVTVDGEGVGVATSDTVADLPDAEVGPLDAGPVGLGATSATLPAVTVEGAELLQVGPEPEVTVPALEVSPTEIETPPLHVGDAELDLPDVELPAVSTPEVPVVETVTGLLGGGSGLLG